MPKTVRVRFAPSPTGGLHLGGVRTVLYNYLFAHQHGGKFILRIEDTDQGRFVEGAEQYINDCLAWCGLEPDESPSKGGAYGPYRQSERKASYRQHAEQLVKDGHAYYAFDTPAELEAMRNNHKTASNPSPQYDHALRNTMRNSLTLDQSEVESLLQNNTPYVIRIKMPDDEEISFTDMIRGKVSFHSSQVDDKVLLKADGMPTYHLAVVADDRAMEITHAFRGEEWLPSAPVHVLLWKYLFGLENMPEWAHFPLILGPNGKLSKRDGAKYGFPVFAMNWLDPKTNEITEGFREKGFLPEAFINLLALLGWNDGSGRELFTKEELTEKFSIERVHSSGARFDYEKAKWFNHEWIKKSGDELIAAELKNILEEKKLQYNSEMLGRVASAIKDRCTFLTDIWPNSFFFFEAPKDIDTGSIKQKWNSDKAAFFKEAVALFAGSEDWTAHSLENKFKELAAGKNIKAGEVLMPLRIMLVGQKTGPGVFEIAEIIGKTETGNRILHVINHPALSL
ncbi:MAG: glutamate--tRNA ligase [Chitinophagaceae bacterium]|nr:glutamate--tRNA ligase [Chitinophagaceae bacterium]